MALCGIRTGWDLEAKWCHDGLTKERTLGYRAWGSTLGFRGSILGVTSLWENVAFEGSVDICIRK
jgi:hypothetical protein